MVSLVKGTIRMTTSAEGRSFGSFSMPWTPSRAVRATRTKLTPEGLEPLLDSLADGAVADDEHVLAMQLVTENRRVGPLYRDASVVQILSFLAARPDPGMLQLAKEWKVFCAGENGSDRPFGGGDGMNAARVAEDDARRDDFQQPIDSGDGGLNHVQSAKKRQLPLRLARTTGGAIQNSTSTGCVGLERDQLQRNAIGQQPMQIRIDSIQARQL